MQFILDKEKKNFHSWHGTQAAGHHGTYSDC